MNPLSTQQLIDCSSDRKIMEDMNAPEVNIGCVGGYLHAVIAYTTRYPMFSAKNYPYKGYQDQCRQDKTKGLKYQVAGYEQAKSGNVTRVLELLKNGPVIVEMSGSQAIFKFYSKGVINDQDMLDRGISKTDQRVCAGGHINHAALVVGWGHDETFDEDYFIVKNSFGSSWGEQGFVRISTKVSPRLPFGSCNILNFVAQVI